MNYTENHKAILKKWCEDNVVAHIVTDDNIAITYKFRVHFFDQTYLMEYQIGHQREVVEEIIDDFSDNAFKLFRPDFKKIWDQVNNSK